MPDKVKKNKVVKIGTITIPKKKIDNAKVRKPVAKPVAKAKPKKKMVLKITKKNDPKNKTMQKIYDRQDREAEPFVDAGEAGAGAGEPAIPFLSKEEINALEKFIDAERGTKAFSDYLMGWSYYDGGNFEKFSDFWEKKAQQVNKYINYFEFLEFLKKNPMIEKSIVLTAKKINSDFKGYSWNRPLANLVINNNKVDQETFYNDDYAEYYPEDKYDFIYDDDSGEYSMSSRTRSTTNKLVKAIIDEELKGERKKFKDLLKLLK